MGTGRGQAGDRQGIVGDRQGAGRGQAGTGRDRQCADLNPLGAFPGSVDLEHMVVLLLAPRTSKLIFTGLHCLGFHRQFVRAFFPASSPAFEMFS